MPKVSIIVPVYNTEEFIRTCLDSIIAQTFKDFEVIIIDDGSTDNCGKICDEYALEDNRIKVFHRKNHGISSTRNYGLSNAQGEFVCFVDSDDFIHPRMIEALYNEIIKGDYSFCMCLEQNVEKMELLGKSETIEKCETKVINEANCIYGITHEGFDKRHFVHCLAKLYKKDILDGLEFDEEISLSEDMLYNFQLYTKGVNVVRIMAPMYYRTLLRGDSLSSPRITDTIYNAEMYLKTLSFIPLDKTLFRAYVLENIMNRIVKFKKRSRKTNIYNMAKTKGQQLFSCTKKEFIRNRNIPFKKKIKLLLKYYLY